MRNQPGSSFLCVDRHGSWIARLVLLGASFGWSGWSSAGAPPRGAARASSVQQVPPQALVAMLETRAPSIGEFLLRGTIPVPRGTFPRADGRQPFTVLDHDGTPLVTQTEIVSHWPDAADGADVVEVIARVHRDPRALPGTQVRYPVILAVPPTRGEGVPDTVQDFLRDPRSIEIATYDCFGNKYVCHPLDGTGSYKLMRHGSVHTEVRAYQVMTPVRAVPGSTLPHFFGVHAYVSHFAGSEVLGLDLRFHNGHDGNDVTTARDDPLDKVYFRKIEISLPPDGIMFQDFEDPFFGQERLENGRRIIPLVAPLPGGKLHVMRWQGQFHRRLMIATRDPAVQAEARAYLNGVGHGFCVRGVDHVDGEELWSWWNRQTARYFPQRQQLPLLDHLDPAGLAAQVAGDLSYVSGHLEDGSGDGTYPIESGVLGWGHPYGVNYGGMTGGPEIFCYDGLVTAATASTRGYQYYTGLHRMQTDRMPTALYAPDGEPASISEWLVDQGPASYVPFHHFIVPLLWDSYPDPFGFRDAPRFQIDHVRSNSLQPNYEWAHFAFEPYDYQHFVRYTRAAKVLAWLGNDSLAKDDLRMQAENFQLSFHTFPNDRYGATQVSGMRAMFQYVGRYPGQGCPFGRGEAWGADCVIAAYATSDLAWRARKRPWFGQLAELLLEGQNQCSGFIQAFVSEKALGGKYLARQLIEQSITEHMLVGLYETVFRDVDPAHGAMVRDILERSLYAFIGEMSWFPGEAGPWRYTGVGPPDADLPAWCRRSQMPPDAWTAGDIETFQDWASFAYGFQLTSDQSFLHHARVQIGARDIGELMQRLESSGTNNLENRAPLLALMQHLHGQL